MKNYLVHLGIDISKSKLDVNLLTSQNLQSEHFVIDNNPKAISEFVKMLIKRKLDIKQILFCCENTGIYTNHLSYTLSNLELDLWIVPAIEIKRSKGISRGKNDKTDAKDIAFYSLRNIDKLNLYAKPDVDIDKLKLLHTEREKVLKALLLLETTKENELFIPKSIYSEVSKINQSTINGLKKSLKEIEKRIQEVIKKNDKLETQNKLIQTIPGIGKQTALYFIIATKGFSAFTSWRKFACYSGVAPFEYSSGSSIKGRTKVNHMADKKMKSLLQMCAMTTLKYDPQLKEYYTKKKGEGKNAMLVLNNIRCKLISRVFAVINRETPYINTYKFAS
ncbi:transposase [Flavobacterium eburneipallidum]|uniref:transposase n=1 Tax=Flavobacterium eburneipallidum TaxID=3003263 RepID=UPI0022ABF5CB|nr:transposase [Flavobacterium eburneipallidum]